jgi:hypothetical protein
MFITVTTEQISMEFGNGSLHSPLLVEFNSGPSYSMDTRGSFPNEQGGGVKRPGHESDHSPSSSAEVSAWSYISIPPYVFMMWCLIK